MFIHFGKSVPALPWKKCIVSVGTFDGVHLGHQQLIKLAIDTANNQELPSLVITFDRNPLEVLAPERAPKPLGSLAAKIKAIEAIGPTVLWVVPFDEGVREISAARYLETLKEKLGVSHVVVGHDFAFGKGREGTAEWIASRIDTTILQPIMLDGQRISSSTIRKAVEEGLVDEAHASLGRPYALSGVVGHGQKLGRQLGYPTANLDLFVPQVVPADGIYAGSCLTQFGNYKAAISIGLRPTVDGKHRTIEAFLMNYPGHSLYGQFLELCFHRRIREEMKFDSLDALKIQMANDVVVAEELVNLANN